MDNLSAIFTSTPLIRKKLRQQSIAKWLFFTMAVMMIIPLVLIISYLVIKAMPALSLDFLLDPPIRGMKAGGIWPALLGTIYLVVISLAVAAPIGVLAAVYLNEYARDNWFNRIINLAVINLAGVPSIVHALFGLGAFVLAAGIEFEELVCAILAGATLAQAGRGNGERRVVPQSYSGADRRVAAEVGRH
jgi:phosphate transport system permease protein